MEQRLNSRLGIGQFLLQGKTSGGYYTTPDITHYRYIGIALVYYGAPTWNFSNISYAPVNLLRTPKASGSGTMGIQTEYYTGTARSYAWGRFSSDTNFYLSITGLAQATSVYLIGIK